MDSLTKKLAEALEEIIKRIEADETKMQIRDGGALLRSYGIAQQALAEYREQEKKPKTELVELDKDKLGEIANDCLYVKQIVVSCRDIVQFDAGMFIDKIYQTFGTKRVSLVDIKDLIALKLSQMLVDDSPDKLGIRKSDVIGEAINQLIYGKAVEDESR